MTERVQLLRKKISLGNSNIEPEGIEKTALLLEGMNFNPIFLLDVPNFLRITKKDMLKAFDHVASHGEEELKQRDFKQDIPKAVLQQLNMMTYWYVRLLELRKDDPHAWDEINELYEDD